jgi:hypothetical protein
MEPFMEPSDRKVAARAVRQTLRPLLSPRCRHGKQIEWELINIFRYTDDGHLVEEWVQTDTYDFLRQLGAVK